MNKLFIVIAVALMLAACGKSSPGDSIESVESLVAKPERLREPRAACKADHARVGDAQCNAVAEATRRRFFGSGGPKYTPSASPPGGFWQEEASKPAGSAPPAPSSPSPPSSPAAPKE